MTDENFPLPPTPGEQRKERRKKYKRLTKEQRKFIIANSASMSDVEMAKELDVSVVTLRVFRRKAGIKKGMGTGIPTFDSVAKTTVTDPTDEKQLENLVVRPSIDLDEEGRKKFLRLQLQNTMYWKTVCEQLTVDEQDFYIEEWGALYLQFEDVVSTERRQIDELIKAEIMQNRIGRNIKIVEKEIDNMATRIEKFRQSNDVTNDEAARQEDQALMIMVRQMSAQSQLMSNDWQKFATLKNKILEELNARRKDRVNELTKSKTTFMGLVEALRDRKVRMIQGRHAEILRLSKENKKNKWRDPVMFPDGKADPVLLDYETMLQKDAKANAEASGPPPSLTSDRNDDVGNSPKTD